MTNNTKEIVKTDIPWKILRKTRDFSAIRISEVKKNKFLQAYKERFNKAKAAYKAGLSVQAVYHEMKHNPDFQAQVKEVELTFTENMIESGVEVALLPTREGATDRKTFLMALDDRFKTKPIEINTNVTLNTTNSIPRVRKILQKYNAVNADFKEVDDE